jgi:hypothetical protein
MKDSNMHPLSGFARIDQLPYHLMNQLSKQPFGDVLLFSELPLSRSDTVVFQSKQSRQSAQSVCQLCRIYIRYVRYVQVV